MKPLRLCFRCSGKFSELLPRDLETSGFFVEDLISIALKSLPFPAIVKPVRLYFSSCENAYIIQVCVWYFNPCNKTSDEVGDIELQIEVLISQTLLQLCHTVSVYNCSCWQPI